MAERYDWRKDPKYQGRSGFLRGLLAVPAAPFVAAKITKDIIKTRRDTADQAKVRRRLRSRKRAVAASAPK